MPPDVSEYEALRLQNMAANSQFLESLGIPLMKPSVIASKSKGKFFIQRRHLIFSCFVFIFFLRRNSGTSKPRSEPLPVRILPPRAVNEAEDRYARGIDL